MKETSGHTEQVRQMCRRLRPILGAKMDQLFLAYRAEDEDGREQVEAYLEALLAQHLPQSVEDASTTDLVPPSRELAKGDYPIGTVAYAGKPLYEFGIREKECIQHIACFGRTGAGKTNLGFILFSPIFDSAFS